MFQAGIIDKVDSDNLRISLEPEAASLHCRSIGMNKFLNQQGNDKVEMAKGTKYIILDAGGKYLFIITINIIFVILNDYVTKIIVIYQRGTIPKSVCSFKINMPSQL